MPNPLYGVPNFFGNETNKILSASKFTTGAYKVYWAPEQDFNDDPYNYVPPPDWPKANFCIRIPKVVRVLYDGPHQAYSNGSTTSDVAWGNVVAGIKSAIEALDPNVSVQGVPTNATTNTFIGGHQLTPWDALVPTRSDVASGDWLGTDVLWIVVLHCVEANSYYCGPGGIAYLTGTGPFGAGIVSTTYFDCLNPGSSNEPTPTFSPVQAQIAAAYPNYRRYALWLYADSGTHANPDLFRDPCGFGHTVNIYNDTGWQTFLSNVANNSGPYSSSSGLKNYGAVYKGTTYWVTASANDFIPDIKTHFGL